VAREAWSLASRAAIEFGAAATASDRQSHSRTHVAATILSSLIAFGLAPSIVAAQSHLPQCPSDRNQVWSNCTAVYSYPDGSRYVGEFRDNKRNGQGTLTFANGDKYVGEWSDGKENGQGTYTTSAIGVIAKEMGGALKRTLMGVATLASSEVTKDMDRARSRGLMEANMSANGGITKKMDRAPIHFPAVTNTSAK
jgi:hypothetical protein